MNKFVGGQAQDVGQHTLHRRTWQVGDCGGTNIALVHSTVIPAEVQCQGRGGGPRVLVSDNENMWTHIGHRKSKTTDESVF